MADLKSNESFIRVALERRRIGRLRVLRGDDPSSNLVGLALSSGGLRSAAFCLGVLQGLARAGLLRGIDYLSCVGGGGYIGGRIAARIAREGFEKVNQQLGDARWDSSLEERLPNAPSTRFLVNSAIGILAPGLLLLTGLIAVYFGLVANPVTLELLFPGLSLTVVGAGLLILKMFLPTGRSISRFVGAQYLKGDIMLVDLESGEGPYPLFGAAVSEREPVVLSPVDRFSTAQAITASGPPPDKLLDPSASFLSRWLARDRSPIPGLLPGSLFDSLGIYELIRRRCQFVIACDGTPDPDANFEALGAVIRKCRLDFGVEVEFSVEKRARKPYQIGAIQYPDGETGFLLLLKPTLTGDESRDLLLYASRHSQFPMSDAHPSKFDDAEYISYRELGDHAIEILAKDAHFREGPRVSLNQAFRSIRRQLRPDLENVEPLRGAGGVPAELTEAIASGECILCAGAGLAAQAGLPTWPALLQGLLAYAKERSIDASAAKELDSAIEAGDLEEVGDELAHRVPHEDIVNYLNTVLSPSARPSHAHELLAQMPFLGALNTGLDHLLASAFNTTPLLPGDTPDLVSALQSRSRFTLNVSGSPTHPDSVVLNARQFRVGVSENPQFKQFLGTLFLQYHTLFVGSNVDGIRGFLDALGLSRPSARRQYALIPREGQLDRVKVRYLDRTYNVQILEYEPGFNYAGFVEYLEQLSSAIRPKPAANRAAAGNLTLKSVTLENIGPFESLHLDLTPGWNLLLGDNGKGKTVILRAIAGGLCGDAADPALLERLLRSGADRGTIRLDVEGREHTIVLTRSRGGKVQVRSMSLSPIQSDRWLAVGFPALRSVPWENPAGPDKSVFADPGPDDLLPLLRGAPDGRVANLKQWLVNLDYAGRKEVIEEFFDVLRALTPGLRIGPYRINKTTMEITIETDGGVVPLSAVSQGIGSVMCWIGTLLQRMREVNVSGDSHPLILVDEVDAHMHPKWQQLFVDAFRQKFPSVQVVATTHSPLMVGSLTKDEIWIIRSVPVQTEIYGVAHVRQQADGTAEITVTGPEPDEEGDVVASREERRYKVPANINLRIRDGEIVEANEALTVEDVKIAAERINIPPEGWRVDQILMLPYFGLERTRDVRTANLIEKFTRLAAMPDPDAEELEKAAAELQIRAPAPHESEAAREAFELIREFAEDRLQKLSPEMREKVLAEAKVQITESITGSRRPV